MAVILKRDRLTFDPTKGQIQVQRSTVPFPRAVRTAEIALNGFDIQYTNGDHHVSREMIDIGTPTLAADGMSLTYQVSFLLRDASGNIDDPFMGWVDTLVIAE